MDLLQWVRERIAAAFGGRKPEPEPEPGPDVTGFVVGGEDKWPPSPVFPGEKPEP
jgi:hypothetical protein